MEKMIDLLTIESREVGVGVTEMSAAGLNPEVLAGVVVMARRRVAAELAAVEKRLRRTGPALLDLQESDTDVRGIPEALTGEIAVSRKAEDLADLGVIGMRMLGVLVAVGMAPAGVGAGKAATAREATTARS